MTSLSSAVVPLDSGLRSAPLTGPRHGCSRRTSLVRPHKAVQRLATRLHPMHGAFDQLRDSLNYHRGFGLVVRDAPSGEMREDVLDTGWGATFCAESFSTERWANSLFKQAPVRF